MTNLEIDQLLHERVMEEKWSDGRTKYLNPSYTSDWLAYGRLLEVAMTKEWWKEFLIRHNEYYPFSMEPNFVFYVLLNPLRGSTAMAEFVKERGI